jgi:hypothetical protein
MTAQHTPGPWRFSFPWQILESDSRGRGICHLSTSASFDSENEDGSEALANAYLIAAAPELLDALENSLEYADCLPAEVALKFKLSVAKARGQQ